MTDRRPRLDEPEQEWIRRCRNGSRRAYEPLVRRYGEWAQAYAYRRVGDREEARDLAQEAFAQAFHALPDFRPGRPFLPWFLAILHNRCASYLRQRRRHERLEDVPEPAGDGGMASLDDRLALEGGIGRLPEGQRQVLVLKDIEGLAHREVAARLGIPEGTVMSRLHLARRRLRRGLAGWRNRRTGG